MITHEKIEQISAKAKKIGFINKMYVKHHIYRSSVKNVSAAIFPYLDKVVVDICELAALKAKQENRNTVLERDIIIAISEITKKQTNDVHRQGSDSI